MDNMNKEWRKAARSACHPKPIAYLSGGVHQIWGIGQQTKRVEQWLEWRQRPNRVSAVNRVS